MHLSKLWASLLRDGYRVPEDWHAHSRAFASAIDEAFFPQGFERVEKRRWVNSSNQPLRHVIMLVPIGRSSEVMTWGTSFDFAPVVDITSTKIRWCRTPKSARQMLKYDPLDFSNENEDQEWRVNAFFTVRQNQAITTQSVLAASKWFDKVKSIEDAVTEFEEWQRRPSTRFGYQRTVMARFYHAFCLARVNRTNEALDLFQSWANDEKVTDVEFTNKLRALLLAAPQSK
jgi:hypothetical protein